MWGDILVLKLICLENKSEIGKAFNHYDLEMVTTVIFFSDHLDMRTLTTLYTHLPLGGRELESRDRCWLFTWCFGTYCKPHTFYMYVG